jgi:hypothetical protein
LVVWEDCVIDYFFNFLSSIASKDAYFGLFATVVGSLIGYFFARRSEKIAARIRIAQLNLEAHYCLILIERELSDSLVERELSNYRDKLKNLYDVMVQLYAQLVISNRKFESRILQSFIDAVMSHLLIAVDEYEIRKNDKKLLDEVSCFLDRFCRADKNFLCRNFDRIVTRNCRNEQEKFVQIYLDEHDYDL